MNSKIELTDYQKLMLAQIEFVEWNRRLTEPLVKPGFEYGVVSQVFNILSKLHKEELS